MSHPIHPSAPALELIEDEHLFSAKARVGQTINDRWHLDALLGIGGMAAVYAATHRNGKRVAVKLLHPELSRNTELRQRFLDEAYAANRVGHPAAVSVLDDGVSEEGSVFLVMDLLDGDTLEARIRRNGRLTPRDVLLMADQLLDVLAQAHDKEIIHRDVKPDNVIITREGAVKLLDFGIARMIKPGRPRTTQSGAAMGTPAFMPPEQARGRWEPLDGRTDIWAVGATMFSALTGRQVHEGETVNEELLLAMTEPAPSLGEIVPEMVPAIVRIVDRALAFDKEDRWPNARSMQVAVRGAAVDVEAAQGSVDKTRSSDLAAESASPVSLLASSAAFTRSMVRTGQLPKSVWGFAAAAAVAVVLVIVVLLRGGHQTLANNVAAGPAASIPTPVLEVTTGAAQSTEAPIIAIETAQPSEPASSEPEPAKRPEPKQLRAKPANLTTLDKSVSRLGSASAQGSASAASPPTPTVFDPLERRK